jgi:hypothetical protein
MIGTFENPTLDLDPSDPDTLDVITATRSGVATYTDEDGLIQSASADTVRVDYTQGEELTPTKYQRFVNTEFDQAYWAFSPQMGSPVYNYDTAPNGEQEAFRFVSNGGGFPQMIEYLTDLTIGQQYTASFYVKSDGTTQIQQSSHVTGAGPTVNFTPTNEWQRVSFTITATNTTHSFLVFTNSNSAPSSSFLIWGPQLEEGTTATDFVANTTGSPKFLSSAVYSDRVPMILVEPSSENLWGWSEGTLNDYQTNAVLVGETYLSDDATSRNGLNSWLYFQPSSDTQVGFRMPVSVTSGSTMILSFYVIMDDGSKPRVGTSSTGSDTDFAILLQGISSAGVAGGVEHISGDLYRVWAYRVFTGTSNAQYIYRYATHSGKGFKISGVMLEESSVPTSYIPTSGSTVTRQADDLVISGSDFSDFFNGSEGTFYIEAVDRQATGSSHAYLAGQSTSQFFIYKNAGSTQIYNLDGTNILDLGQVVSNQLFRAAVTYKTGVSPAPSVISLSFNGTSEVDQPYSESFAATNILKIGSGYAKVFSGHFRRILFWPYHSDRL